MLPPPRLGRVLRAVLLALLFAVAAVQALWMLLLGLAMSYGTPLGAPDSDWRGAAGVAIGLAAVLFGGGVAALALTRWALGAAGTGAGSALYTGVYLAYPGLSGADAATWLSFAVPWAWAVAGAVVLARRRRGHDTVSDDLLSSATEAGEPSGVAVRQPA